MDWPPVLDELKEDLRSRGEDPVALDVDDDRLQTVLDASVSFVRRVRPRFNYDADLDSTFPDPTADLVLGTVRLASRWHTRRRSPDALIEMGELGASRVPSFDPDIDRLLRIGRHALPVVG
jgi:hypothetical protein